MSFFIYPSDEQGEFITETSETSKPIWVIDYE